VVFQVDFDDPRYSGVNPYALGFAMMQDIQRICVNPTAEDREWFPEIAGKEDWRGVLRDVWANYRDESFVRQFLSPHLIRKLKLFLLGDRQSEAHFKIDAIHDDEGYRRVRAALADSYDPGHGEPDIQVVDVDLLGDRKLVLKHVKRDGVPMAEAGREATIAHIRRLWGYDVKLEEGS
jgi:spore cortex formation protein SpoVR/YcgB (stage V sporulation)